MDEALEDEHFLESHDDVKMVLRKLVEKSKDERAQLESDLASQIGLVMNHATLRKSNMASKSSTNAEAAAATAMQAKLERLDSWDQSNGNIFSILGRSVHDGQDDDYVERTNAAKDRARSLYLKLLIKS